MFYVGISRAKENLYVFDHTGYSRSFNDILGDFDNQITITDQNTQRFESKVPSVKENTSDESEVQVKKKDVTEAKTANVPTVNVDDIYELIDGEVFEMVTPSIEHQNVLSVLAGEFYMFFRNKPWKSFLGPLKIKLFGPNQSESVVQPDLFVTSKVTSKENELKNDMYKAIPELVVEVISSETRSKDMIKKMDLYMKTGVKEYWVVDGESKLVMIHSFNDNDLVGTKIFLMNQVIKSKLFDGLSIDMNDLM